MKYWLSYGCFALSGYFAFSVLERYVGGDTAILVFLAIGFLVIGMIIRAEADE